jgi:hypothetical protein
MTKYPSEPKGRRNFDVALRYNTVDMIATEKTRTAKAWVPATCFGVESILEGVVDDDKARRARHTFEAFLAACRSMAGTVQEWKVDQLDLHADINATITDGSRLDFQLVEWLEGGKMQQSVNLQAAAEKILKGLLETYPRPPSAVWSVALGPVYGIRPPDTAGLSSLVREFGELVTQVSHNWLQHPEWNGPQGYLCRDLAGWPTLAAHFRDVHFNHYAPDPNYIQNTDSLRGDIRVARWIMFEPVGGSSDPRQPLRALFDAVRKKLSHYGPAGETPVDLIIHYSRAATRNTPFYSVEVQGFEDVAKRLAEEVPRLLQSLCTWPFRTIYLLDEGLPGPAAFAVYPAFSRCSG